MNDHIYKYFRWLSLDIALGSVFFLKYLEIFYLVKIRFPVYFALASAVWLIYTTDHLIDAKKVDSPTSGRHRFHKENFRILILIEGLILTAALINVVFLPMEVIRNGALLSAGCIMYIITVYFFKKLWIKELVVAVVYAVGIFLAPLTLNLRVNPVDLLFVSQLMVVAFLNLLIFSYYDFESDQKDGSGSLAIQLGSKVHIVIRGTCILSLATSAFGYSMTGMDIQLLFFLMSATLYSLYLWPEFYHKGELFRTIGDGIFYLPLLFVF